MTCAGVWCVKMTNVLFQTIFYWNLAARNVTRFFELHPEKKPALPPTVWSAGHKIELSEAQARIIPLRC